jgi:hypothetical protein
MALPSCAASPESPWSKFSRSTGLLDGLLTVVGVRKDVAPIEICPSSGGGAGYISAARAIAASRGVPHIPKWFAHFHTCACRHLFSAKKWQNYPRKSCRLFPRTIPPNTRGSIPLSHFFAQFDALPEQTDAVLLRFHQVEKSQCDLAIPKDCKDARRNRNS